MTLKKLTLKPGINKEGTNYSNEDGFYNCDKIRFRSGYAEKIGGWQNINTLYTYDGVARSLWGWSSLSGEKLIGIGTSQKVYTSFGSRYYDITPIRSTVAVSGSIISGIYHFETDISFSAGATQITIGSSNASLWLNTYVIAFSYTGADPFYSAVLGQAYVTAASGNVITLSFPTQSAQTNATIYFIEYSPNINITTQTPHGATVGSYFNITKGYSQLVSDITATDTTIKVDNGLGTIGNAGDPTSIDNELITFSAINPSSGTATRYPTTSFGPAVTSINVTLPSAAANMSCVLDIGTTTRMYTNVDPAYAGVAVGQFVFTDTSSLLEGTQVSAIVSGSFVVPNSGIFNYAIDITRPYTNTYNTPVVGNFYFFASTLQNILVGSIVTGTGASGTAFYNNPRTYVTSVTTVFSAPSTYYQTITLSVRTANNLYSGDAINFSNAALLLGATRGLNGTLASPHTANSLVVNKTPVILGPGLSGYDLTTQDFEVVQVTNATTLVSVLNVPTINGIWATDGSPLYLIFKTNAGASKYLPEAGWGSMSFGTSWWGSSVTTTANELRVWSQNNYDQDLMMAYRAGGIYWWTKDTNTFPVAVTLNEQANKAIKTTKTGVSWSFASNYITVSDTSKINFGAVVTGGGYAIPEGSYVSPAWDQGNNIPLLKADGTPLLMGSTVTNQTLDFSYAGKHIPVKTMLITLSSTNAITIAFGATPYNPRVFSTEADFDPLLVRWSDQDQPFEWVPEITNQSGEQRLSNGSEIIAAVNTRQEILIWTDTAIYSMQYLGPPYVFGINLLMDNLSIASQNAVITVNNVSYWMGSDRFYQYSGRVETLPCTLRQFVFGRINKEQISQVICGANEGFNEIWWFYPSGNSTINDSYVIYNHLENLWYYGNLPRTAWLDSQLNQYPLAAYSTRRLYMKKLFTSSDDYLYITDVSSLPVTGTLKTKGYLSVGGQYVFCDVLLNYTITSYVSNVLYINSRYNLTYNSTSYDSYCDHEPYTTVLDYRPNQLMYHEVGYDDLSYPTTLPISAYVESSDFDIEDGLNFAYVWRILPDLTFDGSTAETPKCYLTVKVRQNSGAAYTAHSSDTQTVTRDATYPVEQYTGQVYCRVRGRQMAFRMESTDLGVFWQMGMMRIDIKPDGRR